MLFCLGLLDGGGSNSNRREVGVLGSGVGWKSLSIGFENQRTALLLWVQTSTVACLVASLVLPVTFCTRVSSTEPCELEPVPLVWVRCAYSVPLQRSSNHAAACQFLSACLWIKERFFLTPLSLARERATAAPSVRFRMRLNTLSFNPSKFATREAG